jgi:hypothetical protein
VNLPDADDLLDRPAVLTASASELAAGLSTLDANMSGLPASSSARTCAMPSFSAASWASELEGSGFTGGSLALDFLDLAMPSA